MSTQWCSADLGMFIPGEVMTTGNVEVAILGQGVWLLFSVQGLSILTATIDLISIRLTLELSIRLSLMTLEDFSCVEGVIMDSLDLASMLMSQLQSIAARFLTRLTLLHVGKLILSH